MFASVLFSIMADDDDNIGFNITAQDWAAGLNPLRSTGKRQSKNQAIYGVWAEDDSDEDDRKKDRKRKDYSSAPLNFVSGGFKDEDPKGEPNVTKPKSEPKSAKASTSSKQRTGFAGFGDSRNSAMNPGNSQNFGQWEKYTKGIGSKLLQKMGYQPGKGLGKNQQGITAPIEAKLRPGSGAIGAYGPETKAPPLNRPESTKEGDDDDVASDNDDQGWKKGHEKKAKVKRVKIITKSTEDIITESVLDSWNNKTVDEGSRMKIIDMTGPEKRILSSLSHLHTSRAKKPKDDYHPTQLNARFDVPELKGNLERLIRLNENMRVKGKQDYQRDLKHLDDLEDERERLKKLVEEEEWQLKQLELYDTFVQELEDRSNEIECDDSMDSSIEVFVDKFESFYTAELKKTFSRMLGLDELILCTLGPRLRKELLFWKPFGNDDRILKLYQRVKGITCRSKTFDILLWEYWNPAVARALQQWPSMKNYEPVMVFVRKWHTVLPKWLFEYMIGSHLLPRITREVEEWEPSKDPIPIDQWTLPWGATLLDVEVSHTDIDFLFEPIYDIIRHKLARALGPWQPSATDNSVLQMMKLWKDVFTPTAFQNFIESNIVRKLEMMMGTVRVNPLCQSLVEWDWVMSWREMITTSSLVSIIEKCFFPNWLLTLHNWLCQPIVDFKEVQNWYREWKDRLTAQGVTDHETIKEQLNKALSMMHHRVDANIGLKPFLEYHNPRAIPPVQQQVPQQPPPPPPPLLHPEPPLMYMHAPPMMQAPVYLQSDSINFRQLVEMRASECGVLFMPVANRFQEGKQVFQFGQYMVYIDNQVLFMQRFVGGNRVWTPIMLQELINLCLQ